MSLRTDHLELARADLAQAADALPEAVARLNDGRLGTPRAAGSVGGRSGGSSSPVERAVLGADCPHDDDCDCPPGTMPDPARGRLAEVDKIIDRIGRDAKRLLQITQGNTPRVASDRDKREVEKANRTPEPGCDHHQDAGIYEPIFATGTVSGTLPIPMALCEFCYREVRRKGRLPRGEVLVERHHKGKDPRVKVEP